MVRPMRHVVYTLAKSFTDINIEVEPEIMRHFGREDIGIRLPDREGYVGTLNVYHQLHCIVSIKS